MPSLEDIQGGAIPELAPGSASGADVIDPLEELKKHIDLSSQVQEMQHKQRSQHRKDALKDALTTFLFSVGQGLSVPPQVGGNGPRAFGAALQGPQLLAQLRQQQQDAQAQRAAQMMQAQAALQNAQTQEGYRKWQQALVPVLDPITHKPIANADGTPMMVPRENVDDILRTMQSQRNQEATTSRAEMRAGEQDLRQQNQQKFQLQLRDIINKATQDNLKLQAGARAELQKSQQEFTAKENELNRQSRERIARLAASKSTALLDQDTISWAADQIQRDATLMPTVTAGNAAFKAQVAGELARRGSPLMGLTAQTKNMAQSAQDLLPSFDEGIKLVDKLSSKLGPGAGRFQEFMAGKVGSGDPEFAKLRVLISMLTTGALRAHFGARGGGQQMYEHFKALMDSGKMDAPTLKASLAAMRDFLNDTYVKPVYNKGQTSPKAAPSSADDYLKSLGVK